MSGLFHRDLDGNIHIFYGVPFESHTTYVSIGAVRKVMRSQTFQVPCWNWLLEFPLKSYRFKSHFQSLFHITTPNSRYKMAAPHFITVKTAVIHIVYESINVRIHYLCLISHTRYCLRYGTQSMGLTAETWGTGYGNCCIFILVMTAADFCTGFASAEAVWPCAGLLPEYCCLLQWVGPDFNITFSLFGIHHIYVKLVAISAGFPESQVLQMMEHIEKLLMTRLHKWVFCHDSVDDEQKDLALQRRIRSVASPPQRSLLFACF